MREARWGTVIALLGLLGLLLTSPAPLMAGEKESEASLPNNLPSAEADAANGPSLNGDYRVGSGDVIEVSVWKEPELSAVVVVRPDGKISLPLVNDLYISGMTPMQIQEVVGEKLSPYINSPNVTVIVRQILSKRVYVIGEVNGAGAYQITQPTTVLQILTEAGGLRPFAKEKSIYVLRTVNGQQEKFPFNYKDVVKGKKIEQNILLQPGDTVVVP